MKSVICLFLFGFETDCPITGHQVNKKMPQFGAHLKCLEVKGFLTAKNHGLGMRDTTGELWNEIAKRTAGHQRLKYFSLGMSAGVAVMIILAGGYWFIDLQRTLSPMEQFKVRAAIAFTAVQTDKSYESTEAIVLNRIGRASIKHLRNADLCAVYSTLRGIGLNEIFASTIEKLPTTKPAWHNPH